MIHDMASARIQQTGRLPKLAFLGPQGTYSHQVAYERFGDTVEYIEKDSIKDAFNSLSSLTSFAVIPQENTIFGHVVESYDLFRLPEVGENVFVRGEVTLRVQHSLLVRRGVQLDQIKRVLSHEQALGQCNEFLLKYLPRAKLEKTSSTAHAAQIVASQMGEEEEAAAIGSKMCSILFKGLEILREGIQTEKNNYTRFYIFSFGSNRRPLPIQAAPLNRALIRISGVQSQPMPNSDVPFSPLCITDLLGALRLRATRVDRRPSAGQRPFNNDYFVEVEGGKEFEGVDGEKSWVREVERGVERLGEVGGQGKVLGVW